MGKVQCFIKFTVMNSFRKKEFEGWMLGSYIPKLSECNLIVPSTIHFMAEKKYPETSDGCVYTLKMNFENRKNFDKYQLTFAQKLRVVLENNWDEKTINRERSFIEHFC